jgi:hypothetical protein
MTVHDWWTCPCAECKAIAKAAVSGAVTDTLKWIRGST